MFVYLQSSEMKTAVHAGKISEKHFLAYKQAIAEANEYFIKYKTMESLFRGNEMGTPFPPVVIQPHTLFISEPGVYELIFSSNLLGAIRFRKWVLEEVLPSIRKTGQYQMSNALAKIKNIILFDIENLTPEQFLEYKKELNEKVDEVKIEYHVQRGQRGGSKTQENIRNMKKENVELKRDIEKLKEEKLYFQDEIEKRDTELLFNMDRENEQQKRDIGKLQEQIDVLFDLLDK